MHVNLTDDAKSHLAALRTDKARSQKVAKTLRLLGGNAHHPGLNSHRYQNLDEVFGETIWESYVENHTPSAWRIWWYFGPDRETITVVRIAQHP